jgi:hypothetical protein
VAGFENLVAVFDRQAPPFSQNPPPNFCQAPPNFQNPVLVLGQVDKGPNARVGGGFGPIEL